MRSSRLARGLVAAVTAVCISFGAASAASAAAPECAGRGVPVSKISIQLWTFAEYIGFGMARPPSRGPRRSSGA